MATNTVRVLAANAMAMRTPAGASALRLVASSAAWRIDDAGELPCYLSSAIRAALVPAMIEAAAWLTPATRADFERLLAPPLALAGMTGDDAGAWIEAATETLCGIPRDLLEAGCRSARMTADCPARIVPAILAFARRAWRDRNADAARLARIDAVASGRRTRLPWEGADPATRCDDRSQRGEVAKPLRG